MNKRKVRVYLGGSRGNWRGRLQRELPDIECYNPFKDSKQQSLMHFAREDLEAIDKADVVFFYINYPVYTSSCVEAGYAFAKGKPIVLVFSLKGYIDPLLLGMSRKVFTDLDSAIEWFKRSTHIKKVRK